jgi:hypothetical protein
MRVFEPSAQAPNQEQQVNSWKIGFCFGDAAGSTVTIPTTVLASEAKVAAARTQFGPRHNRPGEAAFCAARETSFDLEKGMICPKIAPKYKIMVNIASQIC